MIVVIVVTEVKLVEKKFPTKISDAKFGTATKDHQL
jgi:hypothetical protein